MDGPRLTGVAGFQARERLADPAAAPVPETDPDARPSPRIGRSVDFIEVLAPIVSLDLLHLARAQLLLGEDEAVCVTALKARYVIQVKPMLAGECFEEQFRRFGIKGGKAR